MCSCSLCRRSRRSWSRVCTSTRRSCAGPRRSCSVSRRTSLRRSTRWKAPGFASAPCRTPSANRMLRFHGLVCLWWGPPCSKPLSPTVWTRLKWLLVLVTSPGCLWSEQRDGLRWTCVTQAHWMAAHWLSATVSYMPELTCCCGQVRNQSVIFIGDQLFCFRKSLSHVSFFFFIGVVVAYS